MFIRIYQGYGVDFVVRMQELLGQCRHYSEKVRLKALHGLTELLREHPSEGKVHASEIVAMTADRAGDSESACREAYCTFLKTALFPALGEHALQPFMPLMMGHICSAMTHLNHAIRSSGIDMMNIVLEWRPDIVAQQYFCEICQHFIDSLGRSSRGRSLSAGSLKTLLSLAEGCLKFLKSTLPYVLGGSHVQNENILPADNGGYADSGRRARNSKESKQRIGMSATVLLNASKGQWDTARNTLSKTKSNGAGDLYVQHAAKLVILLLDCWEECGLTTPDGTTAQGERGTSPDVCGCRILECCLLLIAKYRVSIFGDPSYVSTISNSILSRVFPYFPNIGSSQGSIREIDAVAADLVLHVILESHDVPEDVDQELIEQATQRLFLWSKYCLDACAFSPGIKLGSHLVYCLNEESRNNLLRSIVNAWKALDIQSNERNQGLRFLGAMLRPVLTDQNADHGIWDDRRQDDIIKSIVNSSSDDIFAEWISDIPSFLWKLGTSSSQAYTYSLGLGALLNASRFLEIGKSTRLPKIKRELESLTMKIVPLFALKMKSKLVPGPLGQLPVHVQKMAADVLYHLPGLHKNVVQMISLCIESGNLYSFDLLERLFEVIYFKSQYGDPEHVWNFIYAALRGPSDSDASTNSGSKGACTGWKTDAFVVERISQVALHCSPPALALQAVLPALLDEQAQLSSAAQKARAAYGTLAFWNKALSRCFPIDMKILSSELMKLLDVSSLSYGPAEIDQEMSDNLNKASREATRSMMEHFPEQSLDCIAEFIGSRQEDGLQSVVAVLQNLQGVLDSDLGARFLASLQSVSSKQKVQSALEALVKKEGTPSETKSLIEQVLHIYNFRIILPR